MALVLRILHVQLTVCCSEYGRDQLVIDLDCALQSSKWVDEDLDAFLALRCAVCAVQQLRNPCFGELAVGLV
jgi:hypothetical protein